MAKTTLTISGMSCGKCRAAVTKALEDTVGVRDAMVDLDHGTAEVDYEPAHVAVEDLITAVVNAGYQASATS
jgi:copper chaperone